MKFNIFTILMIAVVAQSVAQAQVSDTFIVPGNSIVVVNIETAPQQVVLGPGFPSSLTISRAGAAAMFGTRPDGRIDAERSSVVIKRATAARICPQWVVGDSRYVEMQWPVGAMGPLSSHDADNVGERRELAWYDVDESSERGIIAGPFAVPAPRVLFQLGMPSAQDISVQLTLSARSRWEPASATANIGNVPVRFIFAPHLPRSIATGAAGTAIANAYGGRWTGAIENVPIAHGVVRPARMVDLQSPLVFGGMRLHRLLVRPADCGSTAGIRETDGTDPTSAGTAAPEDLVVIGGQRRRQRDDALVYLGADALAGCSSLLFDKPQRAITLRCAPATVSHGL